MKLFPYKLSVVISVTLLSCINDDADTLPDPSLTVPNFKHLSTIAVGGEAAAEITAFDPITKKLFIVNNDKDANLAEITVYDISDLKAPVKRTPIAVNTNGAPNSVAVYEDMVAIAVEAPIKQNPGKVLIFNTSTQEQTASYTVGALPDMVTFSPDGNYILVANEGEPNDDYTTDPQGSVSIITLETATVTNLTFETFTPQQAVLQEKGFRIFGPGATLATDVEPEYIAISDNSQTAWITLQENNGIARINLTSKTIDAIYPLGFKDHSQSGNQLDASDSDNEKTLRNWPIFGMYQPDGITYTSINGADYIITANEGDSRDYDGFSEEERIANITLDPDSFPDFETLQQDTNLGRLEITTRLGDTDNDGDFDQLYAYGARSFTIWSANGELIYDSGDDIARKTLELNPDRFNDNDTRSDAKGAEPETVTTMKIGNRTLLFVALERTYGVLIYDITIPTAPIFMQWISHNGDKSPEGILAISAVNSPSGKELLIVSNEDSGTVSIFEN